MIRSGSKSRTRPASRSSMPRWICARSSASSCRWSARLCRQSRRASRTTSLLEAYSPAATAVRTASAISAVRVMVRRSMVFINHILSYYPGFLVSRFRFAGGRCAFCGSRSVLERFCAGRRREPQRWYSFGGFTTSPGIVNFPVGRVWDGPKIKKSTRDALGQKAVSSRADGAGDSAIASRNPWR